MLPTDHNGTRRSHSYNSLDHSTRVTGMTVHQRPFSPRNEPYTYYEPQEHQVGRKRAISETDTPDTNDSSAVRRRISRACDQCNQLRSRCDGRHPCAHCVESQLLCKYERVHKKRGRAPKREQMQSDSFKTVDSQVNVEGNVDVNEVNPGVGVGRSMRPSPPNTLTVDGASNSRSYVAQAQPGYYNGYETLQDTGISASNTAIDLGQAFTQPNAMAFAVEHPATYNTGPIDLSGYGFPLGDDYSVAFMGRAPMVESPDWLALTSSNLVGEQWATPPRPPDALRFPVLQTVLPHLESILPAALACDLLEQYFATMTSSNYQSKNPYVLSYAFRRQSILHPTNPRPCTAALLASMLWIAAQHSDSPTLTSQPDARARTCQKLLELTINMLKPLVHSNGITSSDPTGPQSMTRVDTSLGGLILPIDIIAGNEVSRKQVDNIVTYIHLATVVSASERKAASLRWWNAAWSLAREIRLGRELPYENPAEGELSTQRSANETGGKQRQHQRTASLTSNSTHTDTRTALSSVTEEDREERRRTWWLLYMMDRHLALCYNRPMFFLNKECEHLLQPLDENQFQAGRFDHGPVEQRRKGLNIECTSLSVYGFFLPLMVILGEILDLNHARNRPRFGPGAEKPKDFSDTVDEIGEQLAAFGHSLSDMEEGRQSVVSTGTAAGFVSGNSAERDLQTRTVAAYGTHIMHVLHILLTGKWDPIAMLDDNDLWISSQSFVNATGHAVHAAKALADIIDYDPDLSFMPYFFGIYLLQGSFLLLLFADKLQDNITTEVVRACETIVRAHEACVSTLDNQYQRNFRRVMRSALQQLRGRLHEDATEQQHWRREILKLYRWTGDGTGLAL